VNPKSKKMLAGAAIAGVLVTWVPQLVAAGDDAPPATVLGPANPDDAGAAGSGVETDARSADASDAPADAASDPAAALEQRLGAVRAFLPERTQRDLDVLAAAWALEVDQGAASLEKGAAGTRDGAPDDTASDTPPELAASEGSADSGELEPVDPFDAFLAANPLTGVLYSDDLRFANLGPNVVREGDEVAGLARVATIGPRWIVLERGARSVRVDLSPLQARPRIGATGEAASGSGSAPLAPVVPAPAPSAPVGATGSVGTGPATQDLGRLLDGLREALAPAADSVARPATGESKEKGKKP